MAHLKTRNIQEDTRVTTATANTGYITASAEVRYTRGPNKVSSRSSCVFVSELCSVLHVGFDDTRRASNHEGYQADDQHMHERRCGDSK